MAAIAQASITSEIRRPRGNPNFVKGHRLSGRKPEGIKKRLAKMVNSHLEKHLEQILDELTKRTLATVQHELDASAKDKQADAHA